MLNVMGHLPHHLDVKGLSPAIAAGSLALVEKMGKNKLVMYAPVFCLCQSFS